MKKTLSIFLLCFIIITAFAHDRMIIYKQGGYVSIPVGSCDSIRFENIENESILNKDIIYNQIVVTDTVYKKVEKITILGIGNSFTQDCYAYLPYLLQEMYPKAEVVVGIIYIDSGSLQDHVSRIDNNEDIVYEKWTSSVGKWVDYRTSHRNVILDEDWQYITLQQSSRLCTDEESYNPYVYEIIKYIYNNIRKSSKIGWLFTQARDKDKSASDELFYNMSGIIQDLFRRKSIEFVVPCGAAIQNARQTYMKDISGGGNLLCSDFLHLQEGIPCLLVSYASAMEYSKLLGQNKTIFGSKLRISDDWIIRNNIPQPNGTCVGINDENLLLAQKCAIMAVKYPFEISDVE